MNPVEALGPHPRIISLVDVDSDDSRAVPGSCFRRRAPEFWNLQLPPFTPYKLPRSVLRTSIRKI